MAQSNVRVTKEVFQKVQTGSSGSDQYRIDRFKIGSDAELIDIGLLNKKGGAQTVYGNKYDTTEKYERDINGKVIRQDLASYQHDFEQFVIDELDKKGQGGAGGQVLLRDTVGWTSKNVIPFPYISDEQTQFGITFTPQSNGSILVNGIADDNVTIEYALNDPAILMQDDIPYTLSDGMATQVDRSSIYLELKGLQTETSSPVVIATTAASDKVEVQKDTTNVYNVIDIKVAAGATIDNVLVYPMLKKANESDDSFEVSHATVEEELEGLQSYVDDELDTKQDVLTFDDIPTDDSENPVKSDGIYESIVGNTELLKDTVGYTNKNLFDNDHETETVYGVTFTVNANKTITATGTAADTATYSVGPFTLPVGKYILSGAPEGSDQDGDYYVILQDADTLEIIVEDKGDESGTVFTVDSSSREFIFSFVIKNGYTIDSNLIAKPMIRKSNILDPAYEPHYTETVADKINSVLGDFITSVVVGDTLTFTSSSINETSAFDGPYIQDAIMAIKAVETGGNYITYTLFTADADGKNAYAWVRQVEV